VNPRRVLLVCGLVLGVGTAAHAERGAVSVDHRWGVALISVRAPYAQGSPIAVGSSFVTTLGFRYALPTRSRLARPPSTSRLDLHAQRCASVVARGAATRNAFGANAAARSPAARTIRARIHVAIRRRRGRGFATRLFSNMDHYNVSDPATVHAATVSALLIRLEGAVARAVSGRRVGRRPRHHRNCSAGRVPRRKRAHLALSFAAKRLLVLVSLMLSSTLEVSC